MRRALKILGSIKVAVPLLIIIAGVLAWGTIYEARLGTASVQRDVYRALWFQGLLAFLAVNLAVAALQRYPWKRHHTPFVLAHIGIIMILVGGIIGGIFGVEGQMVIPEGEASKTLLLPDNVLAVRHAGSGEEQTIPTRFETRAWEQNPNLSLPVLLGTRMIQLTVDRYYPDAMVEESVTDDNTEANPAVRVVIDQAPQQDSFWLFAHDHQRFGMGWGEGHVLFLEPQTDAEFESMTGAAKVDPNVRGTIAVTVPGLTQPAEIPVPEQMGGTVPIAGTPYSLTFKDYFTDFTLSDQGVTNRSDQPNNPAISFVLTGPEGTDAQMLFAFHPEFQSIHAREHVIPAQVSYSHPSGARLPPSSFAIVRRNGALMGVMTTVSGERQTIEPLEIGKAYAHEGMAAQITVAELFEKARVSQDVVNRSTEVKAELLHVTAQEGEQTADAWVGPNQPAELVVGSEPIHVEYRRAQRQLPVTIKLLDFRKIDYPGIDMPAAFEADVQMSDIERGTILMRKIHMNHPLKYRGYSFFQSSYIDGPTQTTVLSVKNDPGTPVVYVGFIIVIAGVVAMFVLRAKSTRAALQGRVS